MEKVSIIIGLYNVSSFIKEKKLRCILEQTYPHLEIILVNDGSTDNTLALCQELAETDERIVIVNKENGGLGSARNAGLDKATGDYVWFYDVDDDAELDLIEQNVHWMQQKQVDWIVFSYWCITPYLNQTQEVCFKEQHLTDNQQLKAIFADQLLFVPNGNGFAWNKFYRRSFIEEHHIRFGNQRIQQDEAFNLQFYPLLNRVYISDKKLYHYYIYNSGNTRSRFIEERYEIYLSIFNNFQHFQKKWNLIDHRMQDYCYRRFYEGISNVILFNTFHPDAHYTIKEKKEVIGKVLNRPETKNCLAYIQKNNQFGIEQRLFLRAYLQQSFFQIQTWRMIFQSLRKIKRFFKERICYE